MRARSGFAIAVLILTGSAACSAILGIDPPPSQDESEAGATDATSNGETATTSPPVCAAIGDGDSGTYFPFVTSGDGDAGWELFSTTQSIAKGASVFASGTFDGQYVYFAGRNALVVRFDTRSADGGFEDPGAWSIYDTLTPNGFSGSVFDGHYVYFIPSLAAAPAGATVSRYDTTMPFNLASSWTTFDVTTLAIEDAGAPLKGFVGGVFDGRYVYLVPHADPSADGRVLRYDTVLASEEADAGHGADAGDAGDAGAPAAPLSNPALWSTFDVSTTNVAASGFAGGVLAGNQVYFTPSVNNVLANEVHQGSSGIVARVQTDANFALPSAWSTFEMTKVNGDAFGYYGAAFDGRYIYFAPRATEIVERFDTVNGTFANISSWQAYDLSREVDASATGYGFAGAAFDGRFVYFIPAGVGFATVARYDTLSTFTADCAWSNINLTDLFPNADAAPNNFTGAIFDGEYVYLVPNTGGVVARFHSRTTSAPPKIPIFPGSFL